MVLLRNRRGDLDKTRDDSPSWATSPSSDRDRRQPASEQTLRSIRPRNPDFQWRDHGSPACRVVSAGARTPQQQTEDTAQLFMGVRMQCAQCHHHPYERWSQHDYEALGAFFSQLDRKWTTRLAEERVTTKRVLAEVVSKKNGKKIAPAAWQ